jgi:hypothetical protein
VSLHQQAAPVVFRGRHPVALGKEVNPLPIRRKPFGCPVDGELGDRAGLVEPVIDNRGCPVGDVPDRSLSSSVRRFVLEFRERRRPPLGRLAC